VCADVLDTADTVAIIRSRGGSAEPVTLDVTDADAITAVVDSAVARHGHLDVMVNNAGITIREPAVTLQEASFDRIIGVNTKGVLFGCQAAGRVMTSRGSGSIINIASEAIDRVAPGIAAYAASKAAVRQITRSLASEFAPQGVRVNAIAPGWILTPLTAGGADDDAATEKLAETMSVGYPLGRTGTPADTAYAALYLAADASSWMTGQALRVNGGGAMPW
jgi:3-oxoacyl-[acyl-carrier protein] reductase